MQPDGPPRKKPKQVLLGAWLSKPGENSEGSRHSNVLVDNIYSMCPWVLSFLSAVQHNTRDRIRFVTTLPRSQTTVVVVSDPLLIRCLKHDGQMTEYA